MWGVKRLDELDAVNRSTRRQSDREVESFDSFATGVIRGLSNQEDRFLSQRAEMIDDRRSRILASAGLAVGGVLGLAGTFAPSAALRGLAWGIDGLALVMASALLTLRFYRKDQDIVASGFLVFAVGQGLILSGAASDLAADVPSFGAGTGMWAVALLLISAPRAFPLIVRLLGLGTSVLFAVTAGQIFIGVQILPTSSPLPFYAYPFFVATFIGWIWTLLTTDGPPDPVGRA